MKTLAALALVVASAVTLPLTANANSLTIRVDTPHLGIHFGTPLRPVPVYQAPFYPIVHPAPVYIPSRVVLPAPLYAPVPVYYGRPGHGYYVPVRHIGHGKHKHRHERRHDRRHDRRDRYDD
jgi:hypothetical protein